MDFISFPKDNMSYPSIDGIGSLLWINLNPIWSIIQMIANEREDVKRKLPSYRSWRGSKSTHEIGIAGEIIAAQATGLPLADIHFHSMRGDKGYDLEGEIDVKTATIWPPILKHPIKERMPKWFALVYFREVDKTGCFIGICDAASLRNHGVARRFREDAPMCYTLEAKVVNGIYRILEEHSHWTSGKYPHNDRLYNF